MKNLFLLTALFAILPAEAAIYKWTDDEGVVQFGDCPPARCGSIEVEMEPLVLLHSEPIPARQQMEPETADEQMTQEFDREIIDLSEIYPELGLNPPLTSNQCHSSPDAMGDPDWDRLLIPSTPTRLDKSETRQLNSLLDSIVGNWTGKLGETRFFGKEGESSVDETQFHVRASADKDAPDRLVFDMTLEGYKNTVSRPEQLWFSSGHNRFQSGDGRPYNHGTRQWDTRILNADDNSLEIVRSYRRFGVSGHSVHHLVYRSLNKKDNRLEITDCLYVQGKIASKRLWTMVR